MISEHEIDVIIKSCTPSPYRVLNKRLKSRHIGSEKIRFRCDSLSTQAKVMLARGWEQVKLIKFHG